MELIEKKCPNCGAGLEFKDNDKNCKCGHCGSSFEIKRDLDQKEIIDQYILKPRGFMAAFTIIPIIVILIFVIVFIYMIFSQIKGNGLIDDRFAKDSSELSNEVITSIEIESNIIIPKKAEGENNSNHSYVMTGKPIKEKMYIAYKKDSNQVITIYKVNYHDLANQGNIHTIYVPIICKNIKANSDFSLAAGQLSAPEYYLNDEKTIYVYGYSSIEEAYNNTVKPLKNKYKITEE